MASSNYYLHGVVEGDHGTILEIPKAKIKANAHVNHCGPQRQIVTELRIISESCCAHPRQGRS